MPTPEFSPEYFEKLNAYMARPDVQRAIYQALRGIGALRAEGEQLGYVFTDAPRLTLLHGMGPGGTGMMLMPSDSGTVLLWAFPAASLQDRGAPVKP